MLFGHCTDTLLTPEIGEDASELLSTYTAAIKRLGIRMLLGKMYIISKLDWSFSRMARKLHALVDKYVDAAIERRQKREQGGSDDGDKSSSRYVMIDELVAMTDNRAEIRFQLLNIFLPIRDSIAIGLSGVLFHLARHPRVWDRLRAEVLSLDAEAPVTYDVIQSMSYMKAVLNESKSPSSPRLTDLRVRCLLTLLQS